MFVEAQCRQCDWNTSLDIPDHYFEQNTSLTRKIPYPNKSGIYGDLLNHHDKTSIEELREVFTGRVLGENDITEYPSVSSRLRGHSDFTIYHHNHGTEMTCGNLEVSSLNIVFTRS